MKEDPVQRAVETVFLFHALMALIRCDGDQQRREVEVAVHVVRRRNRQSGRVANDFVERARAEESEVLTNLFGDCLLYTSRCV